MSPGSHTQRDRVKDERQQKSLGVQDWRQVTCLLQYIFRYRLKLPRGWIPTSTHIQNVMNLVVKIDLFLCAYLHVSVFLTSSQKWECNVILLYVHIPLWERHLSVLSGYTFPNTCLHLLFPPSFLIFYVRVHHSTELDHLWNSLAGYFRRAK